MNHLKKLSLPKFAVPRILGVDDFAFCKGQRYGTILVDLELNQPIALLADRKADIFDRWLMKALKSSLKPFVQFAEGLFVDYAAVRASFTKSSEEPDIGG